MKIKDGFVSGKDWHTGKVVRIGVHAILKIVEDVGNAPAADRVYFIDGHMPTVDLLREGAQ